MLRRIYCLHLITEYYSMIFKVCEWVTKFQFQFQINFTGLMVPTASETWLTTKLTYRKLSSNTRLHSINLCLLGSSTPLINQILQPSKAVVILRCTYHKARVIQYFQHAFYLHMLWNVLVLYFTNSPACANIAHRVKSLFYAYFTSIFANFK